MQLVPQLSTISRPIFQDRLGYLFTLVDCPECKGVGEFECSDTIPWRKSVYERCECCDGDGRVFEQVDEDEIINENKEKAA